MPELKIDARLRFDTVSCLFAAEDDKTIDRRIGTYYGPNGHFIRQPVHSWLLTKGPYDRTPLREQQTQKQLWKVVLNDGQTGFYKQERVDDPKTGRLVNDWIRQTKSICQTPALPNAWLDASPEKMMVLCAEMDIPQERGMQAELLSYRPNTRFDYDLGFGVKRIKT